MDIRIVLDRIERELASELPAHMRAFARAHANGRPPPAAPAIATRASTVMIAREACTIEHVAMRGLALLRLVAPLAIESAPEVVAARYEPPSWLGLSRLAAARDAAAARTFACGARALIHRLHGVGGQPAAEEPGAPIDGWKLRGPALDAFEAWRAIAARFGVTGELRIERSEPAQPRAFVIEPQREVVVVVPSAIDTPAARFAVLHELGHAIVALGLPVGTPRVVDEAAASYLARLAEPPGWLVGWHSELAVAARRRRRAIASVLDAVERGLPAVAGARGTRPSWALWHDPFAQAAYVEAEALADELAQQLTLDPGPGQLVRALLALRARIDQRARV